MQDLRRREVQGRMEEGAQVVEVLPQDEFEEDHLPGAVNIPLRKIETAGTGRLDPIRTVIVYCWDSA